MLKSRLAWLLASILLCSNALVAWHSGAHYFEYQSQARSDKTTALHAQLCDVGVLAQAVVATATQALSLPSLGKARFWLACSQFHSLVNAPRLVYLARAPPVALA